MGNSAQHSNQQLYTMPIGAVAELLDYSLHGLWQLYQNGDGPACAKRSGQLWYDPQSVREFQRRESHYRDLN